MEFQFIIKSLSWPIETFIDQLRYGTGIRKQEELGRAKYDRYGWKNVVICVDLKKELIGN